MCGGWGERRRRCAYPGQVWATDGLANAWLGLRRTAGLGAVLALRWQLACVISHFSSVTEWINLAKLTEKAFHKQALFGFKMIRSYVTLCLGDEALGVIFLF